MKRISPRVQRLLAGTAGAALIGVPLTVGIVQDQAQWSEAHRVVDSFQCSQALQGKPLLEGSGAGFSNDRVIECERSDGSIARVYISGYDNLVRTVHRDGIPDVMKGS